jgi:hypothetical protein
MQRPAFVAGFCFLLMPLSDVPQRAFPAALRSTIIARMQTKPIGSIQDQYPSDDVTDWNIGSWLRVRWSPGNLR